MTTTPTTDELEDGLANALAPDSVRTIVDPDSIPDGEHEEALGPDWTLEDLDGATWAARKLTRAVAALAKIAEVAEDQHARIDAWQKAESAKLERDVAFFEGRLNGFHRRAYDLDPQHAISIPLPDGTKLASTAGKLAVEVGGMDELVKWCEENALAEELLNYPDPTPKKAELQKRFKTKAAGEMEPGEYPAVDDATGEVIPGVTLVRKPRSFTIQGPS